MNSVEVAENVVSQSFLAFYLDGKDYGFPILKVNEVIVLPEITPMPKAPSQVRGIINLRGLIIPIIDLRLALGMEETEYDKQSCVIIVKMLIGNSDRFVGFVVDSVSEVFDIPAQNIEEPPSYGVPVNDEFLHGIAKVKERIVMLLNIDKIVSSQDSECIAAHEVE